MLPSVVRFIVPPLDKQIPAPLLLKHWRRASRPRTRRAMVCSAICHPDLVDGYAQRMSCLWNLITQLAHAVSLHQGRRMQGQGSHNKDLQRAIISARAKSAHEFFPSSTLSLLRWTTRCLRHLGTVQSLHHIVLHTCRFHTKSCVADDVYQPRNIAGQPGIAAAAGLAAFL